MNQTIESMTDKTVTPRSRNVRIKRTSEILDAAEIEFSNSGFEGTSVQAIADRAKLQKRQVLYFFQNKENLYRATIDRIFSEWRAQELDKWEGSPSEIVSSYIDHIFDMTRRKSHRSKLVISEMMRGGKIGVPVMIDRKSREGMQRTTARLENWMDRGDMRRTDPLKFIFMLWGFQHFYVAFEPEVAYFLDKPEVTDDDWLRIRQHVKEVALNYFSEPS